MKIPKVRHSEKTRGGLVFPPIPPGIDPEDYLQIVVSIEQMEIQRAASRASSMLPRIVICALLTICVPIAWNSIHDQDPENRRTASAQLNNFGIGLLGFLGGGGAGAAAGMAWERSRRRDKDSQTTIDVPIAAIDASVQPDVEAVVEPYVPPVDPRTVQEPVIEPVASEEPQIQQWGVVAPDPETPRTMGFHYVANSVSKAIEPNIQDLRDLMLEEISKDVFKFGENGPHNNRHN